MTTIPPDWNHTFVIPSEYHAELLDLWEAAEVCVNDWERSLRVCEQFIDRHTNARWGRLAVAMDLMQLLDRAGHMTKRLQGESV